MAATTVQIGEQTYTVGRFSLFKAIHAGDLLSEVMNSVPDLSDRISKFGKHFRETNKIKISRAAAELRYEPEQLAKISEAAWESGQGFIVMDAQPSPVDIAGHVFPYAWSHARDRVVELLALLILSNGELEAADREGNLDQTIADAKKRLLHADAAEITDLLGTGIEVLGEQFEGKAGALRTALVKVGLFPAEVEETAPVEGSGSEKPTAKPSKRSTSTASVEPTAGPEGSPSTASAPEPQPVSSTS